MPVRANQYFELDKNYFNEVGDRYVCFPSDGNLALYEARGDKYYGGLYNYLPSGEWKRAKQAGLNAKGKFALWDDQGKQIWEANIPAADPASTLEIDGVGDLIIRDPQRRVVWNMRSNDPYKYPANRSLRLSASQQTPDAQNQALLAVHNEWRAKHGVPPLVFSPALAKEAQEWANTCGAPGHAPRRVNPNSGENLAAFNNLDLLTDKDGMAKRAKEGWYDEEKVYNYARPGFNVRGGSQELQTGHFTQWVWEATSELGCAAKACPQSRYPGWLVCRYFPGGNMRGPNEADNFRNNVPPPQG